jgi:hypothetical protein
VVSGPTGGAALKLPSAQPQAGSPAAAPRLGQRQGSLPGQPARPLQQPARAACQAHAAARRRNLTVAVVVLLASHEPIHHSHVLQARLNPAHLRARRAAACIYNHAGGGEGGKPRTAHPAAMVIICLPCQRSAGGRGRRAAGAQQQAHTRRLGRTVVAGGPHSSSLL